MCVCVCLSVSVYLSVLGLILFVLCSLVYVCVGSVCVSSEPPHPIFSVIVLAFRTIILSIETLTEPRV